MDLSHRETMSKLREYLNNGALNTVECITAPMLAKVADHPEQKEWLESMDATICCDTQILKVADIAAHGRIKEVESNSVLASFFRQLVREKRRVFLLSDTEENAIHLEKSVREEFESIVIAGQGILPLGEETNEVDELVNAINMVAPSVIISNAVAYEREKFIHNNRNRINADVWLGFEDSTRLGESQGNWIKLIKLVQSRLFVRKVDRYRNQEERIEK